MERERTEDRLVLDPLAAYPDVNRDSIGGASFFLYWCSSVLGS